MENKILISPSKYVQGPGALMDLGKFTAQLGKKALTLVDGNIISLLKDKIEKSMTKNVNFILEKFNGECSRVEIDRIKSFAESGACDVVVGIGGGKSIDTAKAVAYYMEVPVIIVPTIAATDAPCSALSVIYSPDGRFEDYLFLPSNPNVVLVDSEVIAHAPVRFLVSGMGDALATWFEADATSRSSAKNVAGGLPTTTALSLARLCYETLLNYGLPAKLAVEAKTVTPAVEKIIEANTLLSGLGFESGGLAAAHAIHNGMTELKETHNYFHGEKVAFSTIVQLVLEDRSTAEIMEVIDFCDSVGLPVTLGQLGIEEISRDKLMRVAVAACAKEETIHNMPFSVDPEIVYNAIIGADALGRYYIGK